MKSLQGQVVLLTGAGGGFGHVLTRLLLREGCLLILSDLRREALLESATAAARATGEASGRVLGCIETDLSQATGVTRLYADVTRISPRVDILVNNAGIAVYGRFDQIPRERWEALMEINLLAPMRLTHLFLPQMIARRSGHIVNISSAAGLVGVPGMSAYNASKFGWAGCGCSSNWSSRLRYRCPSRWCPTPGPPRRHPTHGSLPRRTPQHQGTVYSIRTRVYEIPTPKRGIGEGVERRPPGTDAARLRNPVRLARWGIMQNVSSHPCRNGVRYS
jgi:hypothetical protein